MPDKAGLAIEGLATRRNHLFFKIAILPNNMPAWKWQSLLVAHYSCRYMVSNARFAGLTQEFATFHHYEPNEIPRFL